MKMREANMEDLSLADSHILSSFAWPKEFRGFGGGASPYSLQISIKDLSTILAVYGPRNWTILAIYGARNK
jgi:hypothetical protein